LAANARRRELLDPCRRRPRLLACRWSTSAHRSPLGSGRARVHSGQAAAMGGPRRWPPTQDRGEHGAWRRHLGQLWNTTQRPWRTIRATPSCRRAWCRCAPAGALAQHGQQRIARDARSWPRQGNNGIRLHGVSPARRRTSPRIRRLPPQPPNSAMAPSKWRPLRSDMAWPLSCSRPVPADGSAVCNGTWWTTPETKKSRLQHLRLWRGLLIASGADSCSHPRQQLADVPAQIQSGACSIWGICR
jgi:hypothetical protein